jgi:hypothetical protein
MDFLFDDDTGEIPMPETSGTLDLKIARLEQYLAILKQQQQMSITYPDHEAQLVLEYLRLQSLLGHLIQRRQEFLQTPLVA